MKPEKCTCTFKEWEVNRERATFCSPPKDVDPPGQVVVFSNEVKNGSISALITAIEGRWNDKLKCEFHECAFMFRNAKEGQFYVAGIGGFGQKFYVAKSLQPDAPWQLLKALGAAHDLQKGKVYDLQIEFVEDRMTLFCDGIAMITATDDAYSSGGCGLRTNKTKAKFENVDITPFVKPRCFVIMPFAAEMNYVYSVIKETVENHGVDCIRADERFVSEPIMGDVKAQIASADLVIIDFTGRNPNVYFEAGLADALNKKWILLAQAANDLTFDVQQIRAIIYVDKMGSDVKFKNDLTQALKETLVTAGRAGKTTL
ncbi:MAG: hypothetical protein L0Z50_16960 [Verrucomicrobiales bacterium]|nr:hypothetical protein [Verrucomicrobiales bacterium]